MGIQDDAVVTCAAYRVTENGQTWCFTTSPGEELMDAAQTLRRYCTSTEHSTGKFISLYSQAQPITPGGVSADDTPPHGEHRKSRRRV